MPILGLDTLRHEPAGGLPQQASQRCRDEGHDGNDGCNCGLDVAADDDDDDSRG